MKIGAMELVVIFIVALLVIGPDKICGNNLFGIDGLHILGHKFSPLFQKLVRRPQELYSSDIDFRLARIQNWLRAGKINCQILSVRNNVNVFYKCRIDKGIWNLGYEDTVFYGYTFCLTKVGNKNANTVRC